jgi:spore coat protein U-like protein
MIVPQFAIVARRRAYTGGMNAAGRTRRSRPLARWLLLLAISWWWAAPAFADNCSITTQPMAFGAYDPVTASAPLDTTGNVEVLCNQLNLVLVTLDQGSGSYAQRTLRQAGEVLNYNLYTDAARSSVWGDGNYGTDFGFDLCFRKTACDFTIYGRIPAAQDVGVGTYIDTIGVTIYF